MYAQNFIKEINTEALATRKILALVPFDKLDYKPHPKNFTLGRLAVHTAEIMGWWKECLLQEELDFQKSEFKPKEFASKEELLAFFDDLHQKSIAILESANDADFDKPWSMRSGEMIFFTQPKLEVVRSWCLNHLYHHRAQLGLYLRLLDIPVPGVYGPSADEQGG